LWRPPPPPATGEPWSGGAVRGTIRRVTVQHHILPDGERVASIGRWGDSCLVAGAPPLRRPQAVLAR
jgi:hypothetical protein